MILLQFDLILTLGAKQKLFNSSVSLSSPQNPRKCKEPTLKKNEGASHKISTENVLA